jgi:hypothetical protein
MSADASVASAATSERRVICIRSIACPASRAPGWRLPLEVDEVPRRAIEGPGTVRVDSNERSSVAPAGAHESPDRATYFLARCQATSALAWP